MTTMGRMRLAWVRRLAFGAAVVVAYLSCATASAVVTYAYTGNCFGTLAYQNQTPPSGAYDTCGGADTTGNSVSGWFALPSAIAPNTAGLSLIGAAGLDFSFSDGRLDHSGDDFITDNNVTSITSFVVSTNATGQIVGWEINMYLDYLTGPLTGFNNVGEQRWRISTCSNCSSTAGPRDFGTINELTSLAPRTIGVDGAEVKTLGQWAVVREQQIPEPATLVLLGLGLAGLGFTLRRQ